MEIGGVSVRKYIIKRILISIVILFFVAFIIYALMRCLPTSYIENMARQKSMQPGSKSFDEWMEQLTAMYNMDKGIFYGFFAWLGQMLRGEFGDSWFYTVPVIQKFHSSIWVSFVMGLVAMILELIIAIPLGVIAATKQYSRTDYTISVLALAGISLPTFFFASLLKLVFSVKLQWFDLFGLTGRNYEQLSAMGQFLDKAHHLVLPIVTLVVISVGSLMRYTRTNMLEVLNADYIRTARAKGVAPAKIIFGHALKNALIPVITYVGPMLAYIVTGSLVVEQIFAVPGIGRAFVQSIINRDYSMIMGTTIVLASLIVIMNLISDILYKIVDPRIDFS